MRLIQKYLYRITHEAIFLDILKIRIKIVRFQAFLMDGGFLSGCEA